MKIEPKFIAGVFVLFLLLVFGTVFYQWIEGWSWIDALYFSTTTLTTIGYGDLHPTHDASKLFTVFYVLAGVSVTLYILVNIIGKSAEFRIERIESYLRGRRKLKTKNNLNRID